MFYIDSKELREKGSVALLQDGVVLKAIDNEIIKVLDDIENPNTEPKAKRKITPQFIITASPSRQSISLEVQVKTDLAPKSVLNMRLALERAIDDNGHLLSYQLREESEEAEGQQTIDDGEVHRDVISLPYTERAIDAEFNEKGDEETAQETKSDGAANASDDEETPSEALESADMEMPLFDDGDLTEYTPDPDYDDMVGQFVEPHFSEGSQDAF